MDMQEEVKRNLMKTYQVIHKKKLINLYAAFVIINRLFKFSTIEKRHLKYFRRWRSNSDYFQMDKLQLILEDKEKLFHTLKIIKLFNAIKNNFKKKFLFFIMKLKLFIIKQTEIEFIAKNSLFFEINYSHRLLNISRACYIVERITSKNKKLAVSLKEMNNKALVGNKQLQNWPISTNNNLNFTNKNININSDHHKFSAVDLFRNNGINNRNNFSQFLNSANANFAYINPELEGINRELTAFNPQLEPIHSNSTNNNNRNNDSRNKNKILKHILIDYTSQYVRDKLGSYFVLWRIKSIKTQELNNLAKNSLFIKLMFLHDILGLKFLQIYANFFNKFKQNYLLKYKHYEHSLNILAYFTSRLQQANLLYFKKIFLDNFKFYFKKISTLKKYKNKTKSVYLTKVLGQVFQAFSNKNKKAFLYKFALTIKGCILYNWLISLLEFIDVLKPIFMKRFVKEFLYMLRLKALKYPKFKTPKIDYLITINTAEVIKTLHSSILTRTKQQKLVHLVKIYSFKQIKEKVYENSNTFLLNKFFNLWTNLIKSEKKALLNDIQAYKELNVSLYILYY